MSLSLWNAFRTESAASSGKKRQPRRNQKRRLHLESLEGRRVFSVAPFDGGGDEPPAQDDDDSTAPAVVAEFDAQGAVLVASGSVGDPTTSSDDVVIDGRIITAENYDSARMFGDVLATALIADHQEEEGADERQESQPKPILMAIANQDFYHREYFETRESLEAAGLEVVVAAATTETATPHAISVVEGREPNVTPDLALSDVKAEDYSAVVFVGGYGAASYQYANETTYDGAARDDSDVVNEVVNDLINDFVDQDKYLAAICNGVSVLAWARVDGASPLAGHRVADWAAHVPTSHGGTMQETRDDVESPAILEYLAETSDDHESTTDDVFIDGNIITAENVDSAFEPVRSWTDLSLDR